MTDKPDLIIAFAFSLMPDGAPGPYNTRLAAQLTKQLEAHREANGTLPHVALQWEVADALADLCPKLAQELSGSHKFLVVQPPEFEASQIKEESFTGGLSSIASDNSEILKHCIAATAGNSIIERLNNLLNEARFYENFQNLKLANLVRPELGDLFTEYRSLPLPREYPVGLRQYQRMRINRLIIEKVLNDLNLVQRGRYLSTMGVIDAVLIHWMGRKQDIRNIGIIAHPLHAPRCIEQTKRAVSASKSGVHIQEEGLDGQIPWDSSTAQVWCQSYANWNAYSKFVNKRLEKS